MMTALIVLAVAAPFLALCIWRRDYALAVFCALLPTYLVRFSLPLPVIGNLPMTLLEVLLLEMLIVWFLLDARKRPMEAWRSLHDWAAPLMLLFCAATFAVLISGDTRAALGLWRAYFLEPLLFFPLFTDIVIRSRKGTRVLMALGALVAVIGHTAIYQKFTGFGISNPHWQAVATRRVTSFYGFPNALALFAAPVMVLMAGWTLALWRGAKSQTERLYAAAPFAAFFLGALALRFAVSEGGMLGVAVGLLALGLFDKKLRVYALSAVIAGCLAVSLIPPLTQYFTNIIGFRDDSSSVRGIIWKDTARMLTDNPVFGAGLSGYPTGVLPYHKAYWIEIFQYPHNIVLNFWSEIGVLGLLAFIWIVARFFRTAYKLRANGGWIVPAAAAAMVTLLVHGLVDVPYFKNDLALLFWAVVGLVEVARTAIGTAQRP